MFTSRLYHQMVTKYNVLFNGEQALIKAEKTLKDRSQLDFDKLLPIFLVGDKKAASAAKPDLEKAISKGNKAIRRHSMMIRGSQKNSFIDDSYLLIGKARYYDRDYLKALETLNYLIQEFPRTEEALEAQIWAGRTETALENFLNAKARFEEIYRDPKLPKHLKDDAYAAYAELELHQGRNNNAYQLLMQALDKTSEKELQVRWTYLAAQLQSSLGNDYEASRLFDEVVSMGPPYEYLFNAQLSRARNIDVDLQDPEDAYQALRKMLKDEKNYDNRDKIYYTMAEIAEKLDNGQRVVLFLNRSIRTSTTNNEQKGLSYLWLAERNFAQKEYSRAQAYYDSSFQNLPQDHPKYAEVEGLKNSLDKLVQNLNIISKQDSLQKLAGMGREQRKEIVKELIARKKKEDEEKALEERRREMDQLAAEGGQGGRQGPDQLAGMGGSEQGFYFYTPGLRSSGVDQFRQRWGSRKLEDHWRRKNKATQPDAGGGEPTEEASSESQAEEETPPKYQAETYLKEIPLTDSALALSHSKIQKALLDNGLIYKEEIGDYLATVRTFEELLERYPEYEDRARIWYSLFRVHNENDNQKEADRYKNLVLNKYPDSKYAYLIKNDGKSPEPADLKRIRKEYEALYQDFQDQLYSQVAPPALQGFKDHQDTKYGPMFLLLHALSVGYQGNIDDYREALNKIIKRFPDTEQAQRAQKLLDQTESPEEEEGAKNAEKSKSAEKYKQDFSEMHRYVVTYPQKRASANQVSIALSDFIKQYYPNDRLRTKSLIMGSDRAIITVSGLANKARATQFLETLTNEKALEKELLSVDFQQFVISNSNFSNFYTQKDLSGYLEFYREHYQNDTGND